MKTLYSAGTPVPFGRVMREHRAAVVPLAIVLAINVVLLMLVVLPLSRRVAANEERAQTAERGQAVAEMEFKQAESLRLGKARATTDLDTFYKQILPAGVSSARRIMELQLQQKAREHGVRFERSAGTEVELRDSTLAQLTYGFTLSGDYDDIRGFIYELETWPNFVVIDNVVLAEGMGANSPLSLSLEVSTYYRVAALAQRTNGR
jgi:Tfp pilus assembly protein PilO